MSMKMDNVQRDLTNFPRGTAPQTFLQKPRGQAPTAPAPKPVITSQQLEAAFNATIQSPEDVKLKAAFEKKFVDAANPNFTVEEGTNPLKVAVLNNRLDLVNTFVANPKFKHDAVDSLGETVLFSAATTTPSAQCKDPAAIVKALLKVVPVNMFNHENETVEASLQQQIATLTRRKKADQAKYLSESVLPLIQAKVAEEQAEFEMEYKKRLAPILRRIDQSEKDEKEWAGKALHQKTHERFEQLRKDLPTYLKEMMQMERNVKMRTDPEAIKTLSVHVEKMVELVEQLINRLSPDPKEGQQHSSSPTGKDADGSLYKM